MLFHMICSPASIIPTLFFLPTIAHSVAASFWSCLTPGTLLPQGLYTGCLVCNTPPLDIHTAPSVTSSRS